MLNTCFIHWELTQIMKIIHTFNIYNIIQSTCVQRLLWGSQNSHHCGQVVVVQRDLKMVAVTERWLLFGGGRQLRPDCTSFTLRNFGKNPLLRWTEIAEKNILNFIIFFVQWAEQKRKDEILYNKFGGPY